MDKITRHRVSIGVGDAKCENCGNVGKVMSDYILVTNEVGDSRIENEENVLTKKGGEKNEKD